jgi:hypothetical protein
VKRRAAVEPGIEHLKTEHRSERNRLKGTAGNAINAVQAATALNFYKLLGAFWHIFLRCLLNIRNSSSSYMALKHSILNSEMPEIDFSGSAT